MTVAGHPSASLRDSVEAVAGGVAEPPPRGPRRAGRIAPAIAAIALVVAAGCGSLNDGPRYEFFPLEDLRATTAPPATPAVTPPAAPAAGRTGKVLLVALGHSQSLYDSDRMVYTPDGVARAYFQYANWTERPSRRLVTLVERRLVRSGAFASVATTTAGVRGDLVLTLRLEENHLDETTRPSTARLVVVADLVDWRSRAQVARREFSASAPAATEDARGAARAGSAAATALIDALAAWVEMAAASPAASAAAR